MSGFKPSDLRHCREHMRKRARGPLDAVPVEDLPIPCLLVEIKSFYVVVEVNVAGAEVAPQQRGVCGKHTGSAQFASATED